MRKYNVIYADPPWKHPGGFAPNATYASHNHYNQMSYDELSLLPVSKIAAKNAVLFLWVTNRDIPDAINQIIPAWGFQFRTVGFNWVKLTSKGNPRKVMGYYFFNSTELCLFCTRGKPSIIHAGLHCKVDSLIMEATERHSQKPKGVIDRINRLFPDVPKIELFARERHDNWDCWGDEVDSDRGVSKLFAKY